MSYKRHLGVNIFVNEKCNEMDIYTSLITTTLLSRSTLLYEIGKIAPLLTSAQS